MGQEGYAAQKQRSLHGEPSVILRVLRLHIARQVLGHRILAVEMLIARRPRLSVLWLRQPPAMPSTKISGHNVYGAQKIVFRAAGVHRTRKSRALSTMYTVVLFPEMFFFLSCAPRGGPPSHTTLLVLYSTFIWSRWICSIEQSPRHI